MGGVVRLLSLPLSFSKDFFEESTFLDFLDFYDYIKEVYNYDEAKYRKCSEKTYALYKEEYDIGIIIEKILKLSLKKDNF